VSTPWISTVTDLRSEVTISSDLVVTTSTPSLDDEGVGVYDLQLAKN
jgi:hypothetical protein